MRSDWSGGVIVLECHSVLSFCKDNLINSRKLSSGDPVCLAVAPALMMEVTWKHRLKSFALFDLFQDIWRS